MSIWIILIYSFVVVVVVDFYCHFFITIQKCLSNPNMIISAILTFTYYCSYFYCCCCLNYLAIKTPTHRPWQYWISSHFRLGGYGWILVCILSLFVVVTLKVGKFDLCKVIRFEWIFVVINCYSINVVFIIFVEITPIVFYYQKHSCINIPNNQQSFS